MSTLSCRFDLKKCISEGRKTRSVWCFYEIIQNRDFPFGEGDSVLFWTYISTFPLWNRNLHAILLNGKAQKEHKGFGERRINLTTHSPWQTCISVFLLREASQDKDFFRVAHLALLTPGGTLALVYELEDKEAERRFPWWWRGFWANLPAHRGDSATTHKDKFRVSAFRAVFWLDALSKWNKKLFHTWKAIVISCEAVTQWKEQARADKTRLEWV